MAQNIAGAAFLIVKLVFELQFVAGLLSKLTYLLICYFSRAQIFSGYNLGSILVYHPPNAARVREVVYGLPHPIVPHTHGERKRLLVMFDIAVL